MRQKPWRHSAGDGRGARDVFLDGVKVSRCVFADERRGRIKVVAEPFRVSKSGNVVTHLKRGKVEVRPK